MAEVATYDSEAKFMKKWIIRTLTMEKLLLSVYTELEEIDKYFKEGPDTSDIPQHLAFADVLGVTIEDLTHTIDRDFYKKYVILPKFVPKLEEKYGEKQQETS